MVAASQRGLNLSMFEDMDIGDIIDYIITYNNMQLVPGEKAPRQATQEDWNAF